MSSIDKLQSLVKKYNSHPEFLGMDLSHPNQLGAMDDTLLHLVARVGTTEEIDLLVAAKLEIDSIGDMGFTPLHYAAGRGRSDVVEHLLALGADRAIRNEFETTAEESAEIHEHPEIAEFIRNFTK